MSRFRKRPEEVEAVQWTGENLAEVGALTEPDVPRLDGNTRTLYLGGDRVAVRGDYIIRDSDGALDALSAKTFEATYKPATPPALDALQRRVQDWATLFREEERETKDVDEGNRAGALAGLLEDVLAEYRPQWALDAESPSTAAIEAAMSGHPESWRETIEAAVRAALSVEGSRRLTAGLDAEDQERLEELIRDLRALCDRLHDASDTERACVTGAQFARQIADDFESTLRRLASHQPESQEGAGAGEKCRCCEQVQVRETVEELRQRFLADRETPPPYRQGKLDALTHLLAALDANAPESQQGGEQ